jgi:hypothetical protein
VSAPHWDEVYRSRGADEVSWFQPSPVVALELIAASGVSLEVPVIDVGAGASTLVDGLLARGHRDITLLDVAASAFAPTRTRLGPSAVGARRASSIPARRLQARGASHTGRRDPVVRVRLAREVLNS